MSDIEKRTFSLPAEQAAFIDAKVSSGAYASASEVVRAGLRRCRSATPLSSVGSARKSRRSTTR